MVKSELTIGERLEDVIKTRKLTHKQVATGAGVSESLVSELVNNNRVARSDSIIALCQYLDISADYLLGLSEVEKPDTKKTAVASYLGLSGEAINNLLKLRDNKESYRFLDYILSDRVSAFCLENLLSTIIDGYHFSKEYNQNSKIAEEIAERTGKPTPILMLSDCNDYFEYKTIKSFLRLREFGQAYYNQYYAIEEGESNEIN